MDNQTPISAEEPSSSEEIRNWLELPSDVIFHIFLKLGAIDILFRAQSVCSLWRKVSKEPLLFRSIDMRNRSDLLDDSKYNVEKMAREAVDRSCGQLVEFSMDNFGSDELLAHIADIINDLFFRSGELRCLRLVSCHQVSGEAFSAMAKKAVMLEELEICHCSLSEDTLIAVGYRRPHRECDNEALAVAGNMPELRHLHLFGNKLTNVGLKAILDGCLHLESLDLRQCFNVNLEGDLLKSCRDRLVKLKLPNDSTDDCEFDAAIDDRSYEFSEGYSDLQFGLFSYDPIFGAIDILLSAQSVCPTWRKVSKEPMLFRSIDMRNRCSFMYDMEKIAREAVDRSCGQLVEFSMDGFNNNELLAHIKAVMLEELEIRHCSLLEDLLIAVGNACPQLKTLRLNSRSYRGHTHCRNMPELRHLRLFGNNLTNVGLKAILDGCLHLESLDLRQCFNLNLEGDLLRSCGDRLIKLRLPNDSTDDYEFDDAIELSFDLLPTSREIMDNQTLLSSEEEVRNWSELPHDILSHIFLKLGAIDILFNVQSVCSVWREVSKEPWLFRSIEISLDMQNRWRHAGLFEDRLYQLEKLAKQAADRRSCGQNKWENLLQDNMYHIKRGQKEAVDRSCGQLVKSASLRCLRLVSCDKVSEDALVNMAKKAVLLEELEICHCSFSADMLKTVGKALPQLRFPHRERDDEALAIAENMPELPFSMDACTLSLSIYVNASTLI
ncbi:hypothetical protein MKW92_037894 [Papaver armeniacum]|nr:hypothetical protein MKW92_037894 [Papaver armeniacum]